MYKETLFSLNLTIVHHLITYAFVMEIKHLYISYLPDPSKIENSYSHGIIIICLGSVKVYIPCYQDKIGHFGYT